jgi:uncharacterized protein YjlB
MPPKFLEILRRLLNDGVDNVVHRHNTDHAIMIDHRNRQQVVLGNEPGNILSVGKGRYRNQSTRPCY